MYNLRKKLEKDKNPAQMVINLLMNSMYGKTVIRPLETDTVLKDDKDDFGKYAYFKYSYIDSGIEFNGNYYIEKIKTGSITL